MVSSRGGLGRRGGRGADLDELHGGVLGAEVAAEGEEEHGGARHVGRVVEVARPEGRQPAPAPQAQAPADRVRLQKMENRGVGRRGGTVGEMT